jgi:hypothetical protein
MTGQARLDIGTAPPLARLARTLAGGA